MRSEAETYREAEQSATYYSVINSFQKIEESGTKLAQFESGNYPQISDEEMKKAEDKQKQMENECKKRKRMCMNMLNSLADGMEMKTAALLHKVNTFSPTVLPARQVLEMGTVNGAKALGIEAGMLKVGKKADLIVVDMRKPHLTPCFDIHSHLVYSARGSDVRTTIVDGKLLMDDYRVLAFDEQKVLEEAQKAAEELIARANA